MNASNLDDVTAADHPEGFERAASVMHEIGRYRTYLLGCLLLI